jgi:hypothetical protein
VLTVALAVRRHTTVPDRERRHGAVWSTGRGDSVAHLMGSLVKKRRKRMRKKKHKKMLRRTRHQRRK